MKECLLGVDVAFRRMAGFLSAIDTNLLKPKFPQAAYGLNTPEITERNVSANTGWFIVTEISFTCTNMDFENIVQVVKTC